MRRAIDRLFFGEVLAARPYVLRKAFLLVLGFDCLVDLVPHGGRYGVGGFNVAHFAILDRWLPTPTPALYVGSLIATGLVALALALGPRMRGGIAALAALYTATWAMSMLDSYQHHYLLSLLLVSIAAFPDDPHASSGSEASGSARTPAIGYVSFALTCAIVYGYTALTKLEPDWRSGAALARLSPPDAFPWLFRELAGLGVDEAGVYRRLAHGAILVQLASSLAYVASTTLDRQPSRVRRLVVTFLGGFPVAFHLGVSALDLEIGWFGAYMLVSAFVFFAPGPLVAWLAAALARPERAMTRSFASGANDVFASAALAVVAAPVIAGTAGSLDLPGDLGGGIVAALIVVALALGTIARGRPGGARALVLSAVVGCALAYAAVTHGAPSVRYDYYRFVGGDRRRRGETAAAIAAYRKAYAYAPDGQSREETARKLARLGAGDAD
ncbi:MAG: HTTM domain-containing protein [Polyangiales bacterium]